MRVLVCGSRYWDDRFMIESTLLGLLPEDNMQTLTVIEGGAQGADEIAANWVKAQMVALKRAGGGTFRFDHDPYPADWPPYGSSKWEYAKAGHDRNERMLAEGQPDLVIAFKDGFDWQLRRGGTEHMAKIAKREGVPVWVHSHLT